MPRRLDNGSAAELQFNSAENMHRAQCFVAIDACLVELNRRFREESYAPLQQFESAVISAANGLSFELSENFQKSYEKDVNFDSLQSELKLLETVTKQTFPEIKRVTSMETVVSILTYGQNGQKTHLPPNVLRLMHIYLLTPLTTASAERSFSVQRSLKTYLRITEKWCNKLLMLNMHKARTDSICLKTIAKEFVGKNERRLTFFGKF